MTVADLDLTTVDGLLVAVADFDEKYVRQNPTLETAGLRQGHLPIGPASGDEVGAFTGTFCGRCGGSRRMSLVANERCDRLNPRYLARIRTTCEELAREGDPLAFSIGKPPPVFTATCLQCETRLSLLVDAGPPVEVLVLGSGATGMATASTPSTVAFYLEQAYRSRTRAAYTAAVAMYRVALEQLLLVEGFNEPTLNQSVEAAIAADPHWLHQLDEELMHALRALGNRAVHSNQGDLSKQKVLDRDLVHEIERLFIDVLYEIYEVPAQREARRERFRVARES